VAVEILQDDHGILKSCEARREWGDAVG